MKPKCEWSTEDYDCEAYITGCGEIFQFTSDGPPENNFKFCPYCGGELVQVQNDGE